MAQRRWFQFSLKTLMAAVVLICLGLGGWHLFWTYGQWIEAEPAVVGQPIKIRGRFFHFGRANEVGGWRYELDVFPSDCGNWGRKLGFAQSVGWCLYEIEAKYVPFRSPGEITMTLTPEGGSAIRGSFVVRGGD